MKYVIMIYCKPDASVHPVFLPRSEAGFPSERDGVAGGLDPLLQEIAASGELIDARALADPVMARTIRLRDGVLASAEGPFTDGGEHLAAFVVIDCETWERASEIAASFPEACTAGVEVRPIMDSSGMEM